MIRNRLNLVAFWIIPVAFVCNAIFLGCHMTLSAMDAKAEAHTQGTYGPVDLNEREGTKHSIEYKRVLPGEGEGLERETVIPRLKPNAATEPLPLVPSAFEF